MLEIPEVYGKEPKVCAMNNLLKQLDQLEVDLSGSVHIKVDHQARAQPFNKGNSAWPKLAKKTLTAW